MSGKMFKTANGKKALQLCSIILATLMLASSMLTGKSPLAVSAETPIEEYALKVNTRDYPYFGQNVLLQAGETYVYSYYYKGTHFAEGKFFDGNNNEGASGAKVAPTKTTYDTEYCKVEYEFVAPANATVPDNSNPNQVRIYLGICPWSDGTDCYYYGMSVYAKNDVSKSNLFTDSDFSETESYFGTDNVGDWYTPYHTSLDKAAFTRVSLESLGGLDYFKKAESDSYVLSYTNTTNWDSFGQYVSLDPNKTYIYSFYYKAGFTVYPKILKNNQGEGGNYEISPLKTTYDREYNRISLTFKPSTDEYTRDDPEIEGNKLVYLGIIQNNETGAPVYFTGFSVVDAEDTSKNLFVDSELLYNGTAIHTNNYSSGIWKNFWDAAVMGTYSKVSLDSIGGMDYFKRAESDIHVLTMKANAGWTEYGQWVSLPADKTYIYSYYKKSDATSYPILKTDSNTEFHGSKTVYDNEYSKVSITFTPPDTAVNDNAIPGNKMIYIGMVQGNGKSENIYFYGFSVIDVENPSIELLNDNELLGNNHGIDRNVWTYANYGQLGYNEYEEAPLSDIGGMSYFLRPDSNKAVVRLNSSSWPFFGQWVSLDPDKTYVYSYYHTPGAENYSQILKNTDGESITAISTMYDEEYCKVTRTFKASADSIDDSEIPGNKLVWLGIRDGAEGTCYYNFNLSASDDMSVNLFDDSACLDADGNFTKSSFNGFYSDDVSADYSLVSLESIGGMDAFKYTESTSKVLTLYAGGYPFFGQWVSLSPEKTYQFSYYFVGGSQNYWQVLKNQDGEQVENYSLSYDDTYSKITVTFTPSIADDSIDDPAISGNKLVYIGIRGEDATETLHYYDFKLCETGASENLLNDANLQAIGNNISSYWVDVYGNALEKYKFSETTLEEVGGLNYFLFVLTFTEKCDVTEDGEVTVKDLVRMKKYAAGIIDALPFRRGDPDNDGTIASSSDLSILRKVLIGVYTETINNDIEALAGSNPQAQALKASVFNAADSIEATGTTYYVSENGSSANNGKSPLTPMSDIRLAFALAESGDAVLLERGSSFRISSKLELNTGISYGAYGTGEKPEILGSPMNYAQDILWAEATTQNLWKLDYTRTDAGIIVFDGGELTGNMKFDTAELIKNGDYYLDEVEDKLYVYCDKGNPGAVYSDIEIGSRLIMLYLRDGSQNVNIDNISLKYTGTFGIRGSMGCENISITNCTVAWVGGSLFEDGSNRYGNAIEFTAGCKDVTVENCWIYQCFDAGITFQITIEDENDALSTFEGININSNLIEYCSWAIEWWPSSDNCVFSDIAITDNIMRFSGYGMAGDTRSPAHIMGPWQEMTFTVQNFVISDNIFDCSNGPVYEWPWGDTNQTEHTITGNTYYQLMPTATRNCIFDIGCGEAELFARNQQELESAVRAIDPEAKLIIWLPRG